MKDKKDYVFDTKKFINWKLECILNPLVSNAPFSWGRERVPWERMR